MKEMVAIFHYKVDAASELLVELLFPSSNGGMLIADKSISSWSGQVDFVGVSMLIFVNFSLSGKKLDNLNIFVNDLPVVSTYVYFYMFVWYTLRSNF